MVYLNLKKLFYYKTNKKKYIDLVYFISNIIGGLFLITYKYNHIRNLSRMKHVDIEKVKNQLWYCQMKKISA